MNPVREGQRPGETSGSRILARSCPTVELVGEPILCHLKAFGVGRWSAPARTLRILPDRLTTRRWRLRGLVSLRGAYMEERHDVESKSSYPDF